MSIDESKHAPRETAFAHEVTRLREARGWTLADMAAALQEQGIDYASTMTVSRTEKLQRPVRMIEAIAYGRIFERTVYELTEPDGYADYLDRAMRSVTSYHQHLAQRDAVQDLIDADREEMRHWLNLVRTTYTEEYVASLSGFSAARWETALTQLEVELGAEHDG